MDIKEIDKKANQLLVKYVEQRIIDEEIVGKAIIFFNQYYNLVEHPITREDVEKLASIDFSLKLDFLFWRALNPKTEEEINQFYRINSYGFFRSLLKNMDIMHYENVLKETILPHLQKHQHKTILDYGAGSGYLTILLHKLDFRVSFAEINKISVDWMRYITKELNFDIEVIDLQEQEIENNYDIIILKDVVEHLPSTEYMANLLKKLSTKTKNIFVFPDKIEKDEDYLPMHFKYELKNG